MRKFNSLCAQALPAFLIVAGTAVLLFSISRWWVSQSADLQDQRLVEILRRNQGEAYFNAKLELLNKRAEDIRGLLVYLLAIAGFVTAAQGLFAYFNVQNYTKQADTAVDKLDKIREAAEAAGSKAQERLREIESKEPVFAQMDRVIKDAVSKLALLFQDPDGLVDLYNTIDDLDRQKIMYYEKSVAGFESVELPALKPDLARIYRGLCVFYAAKFFNEQKSAQLSTSEDLHRARMYAELAREQGLNVFCIENALGWIESRLSHLTEAEKYFNRSLALYPGQQRAGTNLGIIYLKDKRYGDAVVVLRRALTQQFWELTKANLRSRPCYNLACALTRVAETDQTKREELLQEAYRLLEEAIRHDITGLHQAFLADVAEGGDLRLLQTEEAFSDKIVQLATQYSLADRSSVKHTTAVWPGFADCQGKILPK